MLRSNLLAISLLVPALFAADPQRPGEGGGGDDLYPRAPVLLHQVSGSTLAGPYEALVTVYSDGHATCSSIDALTGVGTMSVATLGEGELLSLVQALRAAGAFDLHDQSMIVMDLPLTTITVLRGGTDAAAHTFSYWYGADEYAGVATILDTLKQRHFPNAE